MRPVRVQYSTGSYRSSTLQYRYEYLPGYLQVAWSAHLRAMMMPGHRTRPSNKLSGEPVGHRDKNALKLTKVNLSSIKPRCRVSPCMFRCSGAVSDTPTASSSGRTTMAAAAGIYL